MVEISLSSRMRAGVDRRGEHLYPVFPYEHFSKLNEDDLTAILCVPDDT
jgi:hypothetical protein